MKSLHVEGDTFLHRLSPGVKLAGLAAISLLLFVIHSPALLGITAVVSAALHATLGLGLRESWLRLRVILFTIAVFAVFTWVFNSPHEALIVFLRLISLTLFAATITATTSTGAFIEVVTVAAGPLEKFGLAKASDIGLAIGLVIRFVPEVLDRYRAIRDAHNARGLKPNLLTLAVPLIILTLRNADEIAAAIDARGIRRQK